jgi:hypothetical protein
MKVLLNIKLIISFVLGILSTFILSIPSSSASVATEPSGSFICIGNYSSWGWPSGNGSTKEYNEMSYINFSTKIYSVIVNQATSRTGSDPSYSQGPVESGSFSISLGPIPGTFKMNFDKEYVLLAPVNSGNSIFVIDSGTGMTGTCQKV